MLEHDPLARLCELFRAGRKEYEDEMTRLSDAAKGEGRMVLPARWAAGGVDVPPRWERRESEVSLAGAQLQYYPYAPDQYGSVVGYSTHTEAALQAYTGIAEPQYYADGSFDASPAAVATDDRQNVSRPLSTPPYQLLS